MSVKNLNILVTDSCGEVSQYEVKVADFGLNDSKVLLKYHPNGSWTPAFRGRPCGLIHDDGDSVTITLPGKKMKLDYSELADLMLLLQIYQEDESNDSDFSIQKFKEI